MKERFVAEHKRKWTINATTLTVLQCEKCFYVKYHLSVQITCVHCEIWTLSVSFSGI